MCFCVSWYDTSHNAAAAAAAAAATTTAATTGWPRTWNTHGFL